MAGYLILCLDNNLNNNYKGLTPMAMESSEIKEMIMQALPDAQIHIEDLRGDGDHYSARIISGALAGKSRIQQHQMVYAALQGKMGDQLHALALTTEVPA
jgi:stress-induced morphogen